ncbi:MAG: MopE-related protein [bacterium]
MATPTTCGIGACASTGQMVCQSGAIVNTCVAGTPASSDTTCNGIDDNCNGQVDDGYVATPTSCGVGACASSGQMACQNGTIVNTCVPGTPAPSDTTCNGIDDNCNGQVDEGCTDLSLSITDSPDPVKTGSALTYTVTVTNIGPSSGTGVVATNTLPNGVTGNGMPSQGSCTGSGTITCALGNLNNGQNAVITINATPSAEAIFDPTTNTTLSVNVSAAATVSGNQTDPVPANNSATVSTTVQLACLGKAVTKRGTSGNDGTSKSPFAGGSGVDVIHTLSGADWIDGKAGNDTICGGAGNDNILGNNGNDALSGSSGTDVCNGGSGTDTTDGTCETVSNVP